MSRRLGPTDLALFALESNSRPMHAGGILLLDPPQDGDSAQLAQQIFDVFRRTRPTGFPWNVRPVLGLGIPRWETVEVDLGYHVTRVALPAPASMQQLMELTSHLYPAPLDHSRPLWEAYVIEGLEGGQVAIFIKAHHSMFDGVAGARVFYASFSDEPNDNPRPVWAVSSVTSGQRRASEGGGGASGIAKAVRRIGGLAAAAPQLAQLVPDALRLARSAATPFTAARTPTMAEHISPARSFASLDLPLDEIKRIGNQFGGTVNDVVLSVFDDAMHRYLAETGGAGAGRLVANMAVSTRRAGDESANAATTVLLPLGAPQATPAERLAQIIAVTTRIKSEMRRASPITLQLQLLAALGGMELRELLPVARGAIPLLSNFSVSNVPGGPSHALYCGRAKLAGLYTMPIVAGSQAANFTLLRVHDCLCVGIGAARNLLPDTPRLAQLTTSSFAALQDSVRERNSVHHA